MKVTSVHYQKLVNLGDYENERYGAWANVGEDETPEAALAALQEWVHSQAGSERDAKKELAEMRETIRELRQLQVELARKNQAARDYWERASAFLQAIGLQLPERYREDLPF